MTIKQIESIFSESGVVKVSAVIEDSILMYSQTLYDPAEYGPAICEASFELDEDETLTDNEEDLIQYLESLNLDWTIIDTSDY
jgi:ADP-glucose pyrophosphorylase